MPSIKRLLAPEVGIPGVYLIFLGLAFASYGFGSMEKFLAGNPQFGGMPSVLSLGISLLGVVLFIVSAVQGKRIVLKKGKEAVAVLLFMVTALAVYLTLPWLGPLAVLVALGYIVLIYIVSKKLGEITALVALSAFVTIVFSLGILVQGIPILDPALREETAVSPFRALFHGFGVFSGALIVVFLPRHYRVLVLLIAAAGVLAGFKSDAIAVLFSSAIAGLLAGRIKVKEVMVVLALAGLILTVVSTHIALLSFETWGIPPLLYPFYRAGFTFLVFDSVVGASFPLGFLHGGAILSTTQEVVSTSVLGYTEPHIITSTLFGPGMLDFGILGVAATAVLMGTYLGVMSGGRKTLSLCLYAIAFTHTLILIEVGLQLTSLILYLTLLYLFLEAEVG
jgi:hypothetical protein